MGYHMDSIRNIKIFVLYLMENIRRPLDFVTLNDIIMQTDYIMYLDFAEAFHQMEDAGLVAVVGKEGETPIYDITDKGKLVAETLHSDILSSILDRSLAAALRYLDFRELGITVKSHSERRKDGRYDVYFALLEHGDPVFTTTLTVDSANRAERMCENFRDHPEHIYRGIHALFAGNMNFLFEK